MPQPGSNSPVARGKGINMSTSQPPARALSTPSAIRSSRLSKGRELAGQPLDLESRQMNGGKERDIEPLKRETIQPNKRIGNSNTRMPI